MWIVFKRSNFEIINRYNSELGAITRLIELVGFLNDYTLLYGKAELGDMTEEEWRMWKLLEKKV